VCRVGEPVLSPRFARPRSKPPVVSFRWEAASPSLRTVLCTLLRDLPPHLPVLLLCTAEVPVEDLDADCLSLFAHGDVVTVRFLEPSPTRVLVEDKRLSVYFGEQFEMDPTPAFSGRAPDTKLRQYRTTPVHNDAPKSSGPNPNPRLGQVAECECQNTSATSPRGGG
jgi:hypothetical protein